MSAAVVTVIGFICSVVIRMGNNLLLSYVLVPELFGLMALANVILQGVQMCSELGVGPCVIQHSRGEEPAFYNTAWTLQMMRGLAICVLLIIIAKPLAVFYDEPRLLWVISALGATAFLQSAASTSVFMMRRRLKLGKLMVLEVVTQLVGAIVMCSMAYVWPSVWALVAGAIANTALFALLTHFALGNVRNRLQWDRDSAQVLIRFGKWIVVGMVISFLAMQIDRIMLGKLGSFTQLGVYHMALSIALLAPATMERLAMSVQFPMLSRAAREGKETLLKKLFESRTSLLTIGACLVLGVFTTAPLFFSLLYSDAYDSAGWMAQTLCFSMWCITLTRSADRSLVALGDSRSLAISAFAGLIVNTSVSILGYWLGGVFGFCIGVGCGTLATHTIMYVMLRRYGIKIELQDLKFSSVLASSAAVIWLLQGLSKTYPSVAIGRFDLPMIGHWLALVLFAIGGALVAWRLYRSLPKRHAVA